LVWYNVGVVGTAREKGEVKRTTVDLDLEVHREMRIGAMETGTSMGTIIEVLWRLYGKEAIQYIKDGGGAVEEGGNGVAPNGQYVSQERR
jgi:hypothetical protein